METTWAVPGQRGRYRIDMISRRIFTAACLAAPFGGCQKPTQTPASAWNRVQGFSEVNTRRVEVVDGFLDFDYEPMEWKAYGFPLIFGTTF